MTPEQKSVSNLTTRLANRHISKPRAELIRLLGLRVNAATTLKELSEALQDIPTQELAEALQDALDDGIVRMEDDTVALTSRGQRAVTALF
ncbi:MAG: hypothetical protein AAF714_06530 [Pseudomonadota bacterium]